jgi:peptidoglycan/xylan/chitin deacetylase (PgdA/CDA1 family)
VNCRAGPQSSHFQPFVIFAPFSWPFLEVSGTIPLKLPQFRVDRFATLRVVRPFRRIFAKQNRLRIPILMYHSVSEAPDAQARPNPAPETSPKVFEDQMKYLRARGYNAIPITEVVRLACGEEAAAKNCVAITFDDGFRDFYSHAFPILEKYGFSATVYLPTFYIDNDRRRFLERECLTWAEVRELHRCGVEFGSHTVNHARLDNVAEAQLEDELIGSKDTIEDELGAPVTTFAYPYAFPEQDHEFAHRLRDVLKATGYHNGVSKVIGTVHSAEERFFLRRVPINSEDSRQLFAAKLSGDYDWFHGAQRILRPVRRLLSGDWLRRTRDERLPKSGTLESSDTSEERFRFRERIHQ